MTDDKTPAPKTEPERIAKVMARAGVASRREAERMIIEGRVTVNGKKIDSPALDILPTDRVVIDGKPMEAPQETRLWLYYKPLGLVTSESDEKGRQTVFDALPRDLPRVMTVGRLDLNSEGLLLLTNDGELKRRLELPATGWLRRYRVRVNGTPNDLTFAPLRRGVTIDGEDFAPMEIKLDSQQGANAWLTVGIREGKNREIRRAMAHVGLQVNRLIRIGYGPFKLGAMEKNEVVEVKRRVLRDQLGGLLTGDIRERPREIRPRGAEGRRQGVGPRSAAGGGAERGKGDEAGDGRMARSPGARLRTVKGGQRPPFGTPHRGAGKQGIRPASGDRPQPQPAGGKTRGTSADRTAPRSRDAATEARPARSGGKPGFGGRASTGGARSEAGKPRSQGHSRGEGAAFFESKRPDSGAPRGKGGLARKPGGPRPEGRGRSDAPRTGGKSSGKPAGGASGPRRGGSRPGGKPGRPDPGKGGRPRG
ncbi:pseudouridine synthase [Paracoccus bogoriensis]|uniref:pseudouridine synthase n=1 Tax=Paracoccus bogoriensis TaxID=242065 RepID=UPI001CA5085C|nr:pseudouridine synthase [Paracoccus bogoriensis]MBW7056415.1 pseudouridine synthase [Paracoccus bogoriensis]